MGKLQLLQLLAVEEEATVNKAMASRVVATVPHLLSNNNSSNHLNSPVDMDSRIPMGSSHSSSKAAMVNNIVIVVAVMGIITNRVAMVVLLNSHHLSSHLVVMVDLHQRVMEVRLNAGEMEYRKSGTLKDLFFVFMLLPQVRSRYNEIYAVISCRFWWLLTF